AYSAPRPVHHGQAPRLGAARMSNVPLAPPPLDSRVTVESQADDIRVTLRGVPLYVVFRDYFGLGFLALALCVLIIAVFSASADRGRGALSREQVQALVILAVAGLALLAFLVALVRSRMMDQGTVRIMGNRLDVEVSTVFGTRRRTWGHTELRAVAAWKGLSV